MEHIILGRTGLYVSRLGFGGITIQTAPEPQAVEVVRRCYDLGVNFDTARAYTNSEERKAHGPDDVHVDSLMQTSVYTALVHGSN